MDPAPPGETDLSPRERAFVFALSVFFAVFVLSPLALSEAEDGFPLSRYPMFSEPRPPTESLPFVVAELADGSRRYLGVRWWTGSGVHMGRSHLVAMERATPERRRAFCAEVLAQVLSSGEPWASQVRRLRIGRGRFSREWYIKTGELRPTQVVNTSQCAPERA